MSLFTPSVHRAVDANGNPLPGAKWRFRLTGTTTLTDVYTTSERTVAHANPVVADSGGLFANIYLDPATEYRATLETSGGTTVKDIDPYTEVGGGAGGVFGLFTEIGTISVSAGVDMIQSSGYSTIGVGAATYIVDDDQVTANTGTMSRWRRQDGNGQYWRLSVALPWLEMFGAVGDTIDYDDRQTANDDAFSAMLEWAFEHYDYSHADSLGDPSTRYNSLPEFRVGPGGFAFANTIELKIGMGRLVGCGSGHEGTATGTTFYFPANTEGMRVQRYNTSTDVAGPGAETTSADGWTIEGLTLWGNGGTVGSGIWLRARATLHHVYALNFGEHGIRIDATSGGALEGNANNWQLHHCGGSYNRLDGLFINGADTNAGLNFGFSASSNGRFGIFDSAFLNNTHVAFHTSDNGMGGSGLLGNSNTASSVMSYGGNRYGVVYGQSVAASTTQPGTDSSVWFYISAGGPTASTEIPLWVSGINAQDGGCFCADSVSARHCIVGAYSEGGQSLAQIPPTTLMLGGQIAKGTGNGSHLQASSIGTWNGTALGINKIVDDGARTINLLLGENGNSDTYVFLSDTNQGGDSFVWRLQDDAGNMKLWNQNSNSRVAFRLTGALTALNFGRSAAVPYRLDLVNPSIGPGGNTSRCVTNSAAEPTTGAGEFARGDVIFNRDMAAAGTPAWGCTTGGTAGSTAVFKAFANLAA